MTIDEVITQLRELPSFVATVQGIIEQLESIRDQHDIETALLYELAADASNVIERWKGPGICVTHSKVMRRLEETVYRVRQLEGD